MLNTTLPKTSQTHSRHCDPGLDPGEAIQIKRTGSPRSLSVARDDDLEKPRKSSGWNEERRAKQSALMRARKIWFKSTGPKTPEGKARSSRNAVTHGLYATETLLLRYAMKRQRLFLRSMENYLSLRRKNLQNELLERLYATLEKEAEITTWLLALGVAAHDYMSRRQKPTPANDCNLTPCLL